MREFLVYVLPAVVTYPIGIAIGKRLHNKATYWTLTILALVLMVIAVGVASLGGDTAYVAMPVGIAFGVVLGLRHGFSVIPALFGDKSEAAPAADPVDASAEATRD